MRTRRFMIVREHKDVRHKVVRVEAGHQKRPTVRLKLQTPLKLVSSAMYDFLARHRDEHFCR
jgi:hypothetical protein